MATKTYGDRPRIYVDAAEAAANDFDVEISGGGPVEFAKDLGRNALSLAKGLPETALTIGSSIAADVPAGWAGMTIGGMDEADRPKGYRDEHGQWQPSLMGDVPMTAADAVESTSNKFTWEPRGESSKHVMGMMGNAMQTIVEPISRGIDYGLEKGTEAGLPAAAMAAPLAAITAGIEIVPGPQKGATKAAKAATRINLAQPRGSFIRMAEEAASEADFAAAALQHDVTAGGRAAALRDNPDTSMANVAQDVQGVPKWNEAIPETGVEQTLGRRGTDVAVNDAQALQWDSDITEFKPAQRMIDDLGLETDNIDVGFASDGRTVDPSKINITQGRPQYGHEVFQALVDREGSHAAALKRLDEYNIRGLARLSDDAPAGVSDMYSKQRGSVQNTGAGQQVGKTVAARNVATNAAEIAAGQPAPQDLPPVNVETPGPKVSTMERRVGTTGQYRGAPRGTASPQKLGRLRTRLKESLLRGVPGRSWYDRSSKAAKDLTAGREGLRDRYVGNIAVTSADTAVSGNAGFAIKGYNQLQAGDPVKTGRYPQRMSQNINAINESRQGGDAVMLTDKVGPFYEANKVTDLGEDIRPTNDLWMARAFGYTQKDPKTGKFVEWSSGLGEAQHRFMDEEITRLVDLANKEKLGGFDDWTPERVQAAIWVDTKAAREGTTIERAAADFATDLDARSVNITSEATPANALNHQPGVYGDEGRAKTAFDAQNEVLTDSQGRNVLATGANALTRPQVTGAGVYQGQSNPVAVNRILAGTETGKPTMDPSSRKLAETVASTEGMLRGQESVGYNFLRKPDRVGDANAAVVPQVDDLKGLQSQLDEAFGGDVIATPSEEGIRVLKVDGKPFDAAQRKSLQGIVGEKPTWKINSGDLVGSFGDYKPSNYLNTIDDTVARNMDPNTRFAADALEKLDDVLAKEYPDAGPRNAVLQKTRKALAEGGIDKVRELVKQGILPAVVIGILSDQAAAPSDQRQQT